MPPLASSSYIPLAHRQQSFSRGTGGGASLEDIKRGIAYVETRNAPDAYSIKGKPRPSDGKRALGKYQVFETNLPTWTREALGRELTADEFLANPDAQEKVADHFMNQSLQKYGNPEDVASVWFTGRPVAEANNAADYTGTDNNTYQDLFKKGMGMLGNAYRSVSEAMPDFGGGYIPLQQRAMQTGESLVSGGKDSLKNFISGGLFSQPEETPETFGDALREGASSRYISLQERFAFDPKNPAGSGLEETLGGFAGGTAPIKKALAKVAEPVFEGFADLSTRLLEKLKGRSTVSRQFIEDLSNSADLKQPEKDLIRNMLTDEADEVDVPSFANKVKSELLPLERRGPEDFNPNLDEAGENYAEGGGGTPLYENIVLPDEFRGPVANYSEHVYESPIETTAGRVHFGYAKDEPRNYFAHTRIEDLPTKGISGFDEELGVAFDKYGKELPIELATKGSTRRIIEIQSDLFQKNRLESEMPEIFRDAFKKFPEIDQLEVERYIKECL